MLYHWEKAKEIFFDILFPSACLICERTLPKQSKEKLCEPCQEALPVLTALTCPACGARLAENKKTCHRDSSYRLAAAAPYAHKGVKTLIWRLKYERRASAAIPLAALITRHFSTINIPLKNYTITAIPLHPARLRERGFNQAELIAEKLAEFTCLETAPGVLTRVVPTAPQAESGGRAARKKNLQGAFRVAHPQSVAGKNFLIVDDVFTTGATMNEAVAALRGAGAARIIAAVAARAN